MHAFECTICTKIWMSEPNLFVRERSCFDCGTFLIVTDVGFTGVLTSGWIDLTSGCTTADRLTSGWGDLTSAWLSLAPWLVRRPSGWITPDFRPIRCCACWVWTGWIPGACCWLSAGCDWIPAVLWGVFVNDENGSFSDLPENIIL